MNKLIRNIPDDVAELLQKQAKSKGLTLEAYMRFILIETAKSASHDKKKSRGADDAVQR